MPDHGKVLSVALLSCGAALSSAIATNNAEPPKASTISALQRLRSREAIA